MLEFCLVDRVYPLVHLGDAVGLDGKGFPWGQDDKDTRFVLDHLLRSFVNVTDIDDAKKFVLFAVLVVGEFGCPKHEPLFLPNLSQTTQTQVA
jgi:hypothetical protein